MYYDAEKELVISLNSDSVFYKTDKMVKILAYYLVLKSGVIDALSFWSPFNTGFAIVIVDWTSKGKKSKHDFFLKITS